MPSILECLFDEGIDRIERMKRYLGERFPAGGLGVSEEYLLHSQDPKIKEPNF